MGYSRGNSGGGNNKGGNLYEIDVYDFGVKGDGSQDDAPGIKAAIAYAGTVKIKVVNIPDGAYNVNSTIIVSQGIHVKLSSRAVIKAKANVNVIQLKPDSKFEGGEINTADVSNFTKACIFLHGDDIFKLLNDHVYVNGTVLKGKDAEYTDQIWSGIGVHLYSGIGSAGNPSYVSFCRFMQMGIFNFEYGILLETDETITTEDEMAWVNGNTFEQINMMNCPKAITLIGDSNIPRDVGGNEFSSMQVQVNSYSDYAIYVEGGWNRFSGMWWDLHRLPNDKPAFLLSNTSRFNQIESMHGYETPRHYDDKGYLNTINSLTNHIPHQRKVFYPLPTAYNPSSLGNQDDYMTGGHLRGYTVTQIQTPDPDRNPTITHNLWTDEINYEVGNYDALFNLNTDIGIFWTNPQTDYDNPIVLEIDCTSDPIPMLGHLGIVSSYGAFPANVIFSIRTGGVWYEHGDWTTYNSQNYLTVTPPWAVAEDVDKIRITMWGSNLPNGNIQISRVFAMSTTTPGNAFVQKGGGKMDGDLIFPPGKTIAFEDESGNLTPLQAGSNKSTSISPIIFDKNIVGDQDDALVNADKDYTVSQLSGVAGTSLSNMFNLEKNLFCLWLAPPEPIVLQIDFNPNPFKYIGMIAFEFALDQTLAPSAIKVEFNTTNGGAFTVLDEITNNSGDNKSIVMVPDGIKATIYQLKITLTPAPGENIKLYRIMATSGMGKGKAWLSTQGGTVHGDSEFKGKLKSSGGLVIPVRTSDPTSPEEGQMWLRSDL